MQDLIADPTEFIAYIESKKNTQNAILSIQAKEAILPDTGQLF